MPMMYNVMVKYLYSPFDQSSALSLFNHQMSQLSHVHKLHLYCSYSSLYFPTVCVCVCESE